MTLEELIEETHNNTNEITPRKQIDKMVKIMIENLTIHDIGDLSTDFLKYTKEIEKIDHVEKLFNALNCSENKRRCIIQWLATQRKSFIDKYIKEGNGFLIDYLNLDKELYRDWCNVRMMNIFYYAHNIKVGHEKFGYWEFKK